MRSNCKEAVQAVAQRLGRKPLTEAQFSAIDDRIASTMKRLASTEEGWSGMSADERVGLAAETAMKDIADEAARKVANAQLQIVKTAATEQRIKDQLASFGNISQSEALVRDMENADRGITGLRQEGYSRLIELMDAVKSGEGASAGRRVSMFLFDAENPQMTKDLAHEIMGQAEGKTGNKVAQEGAKAWLQVIEQFRSRFNSAGGDIGKLEYGYVPTPHSSARVRGDGSAVAKEKWVDFTTGKIDRGQFLNESGARMSDAEVRQVFGEIWETIRSEGLYKQEPGGFKGSGARANGRGDHRVIHFKDADAYLEYLNEYGRGSMLDAMNSHIGGMARDITLLERYGPNPEAQMRLQFDLAARADGGKLQRVGFGVGVFKTSPEGMWRTLNGTASKPANDMAAIGFQHIRNIQALKLAGTFLKAFPDFATFLVSTNYNRLSYLEAFKNLGRVAKNEEARRWASMHGLMADSASREMNRFSGDNIRQTWSGRIANSQMKLTLLNHWTDWLTQAFGLTKMGAMGRLASKDWGELNQWDRIHLERSGVTEGDWSVARTAELEERNGIPMLTPDAIIATGHQDGYQIANKILGIIRDESDNAVIKPDLITRTASTWNGTQAGTGLGEFARAVMMFKSFPIAMITRHWRRMLDAPKVTDGSAPVLANRTAYMGALLLTSTLLGALSTQASQIARGNNPIDMFGPHALKFWLQAFMTGGGAGFYGDLITRDTTSDQGKFDGIGSLMGPVIGDIASIYAITKGNSDKKLKGEKTHAAAEGLKFMREHTPYVNIWYAKAAIDHAGMHAVQESLSPGYLSKMKARAKKEWGDGYWWEPGTGLPDRGPDIGKAVGK